MVSLRWISTVSSTTTKTAAEKFLVQIRTVRTVASSSSTLLSGRSSTTPNQTITPLTSRRKQSNSYNTNNKRNNHYHAVVLPRSSSNNHPVHCVPPNTHKRQLHNKRLLSSHNHTQGRRSPSSLPPRRCCFYSTTLHQQQTQRIDEQSIDDDITTHNTTTANDQANKQQLLSSALSSPALAKHVTRMASRYNDLMTELHSPTITTSSSDPTLSSTDVTKELSSLTHVATLYSEFIELYEELQSAEELLAQALQSVEELPDRDDGEEEIDEEREFYNDMMNECQSTIEDIHTRRLPPLAARLVDASCILLLRSKNNTNGDNDEMSDAVVELRAGTGGDEATLFCAELLQAYRSVADGMGWEWEVLSLSKNDAGGVREAAVSVSSRSRGYGGGGDGVGPYGYYRFESGVHRVQRVPVNDVRIHTSAASVAVLPAVSSSSSNSNGALLPLSELKIETMRSSGAGGQHVNTTDSAVRITHIPTGIVASIQDERSQHKNRAKAMKLITARVRDLLEREELQKRGKEKSSLMGGGDRSERIRTYNYPQDRVTDHRCKQSEYGIGRLLNGGGGGGEGEGEGGLVGTFLPFLKQMEREEVLNEIEEAERNEKVSV